LAFFAYTETRLMETVAGWLATIAPLELKIELSYQLYEDACHSDALRQRLPELGEFDPAAVQPVNAAFERFLNELTNARSLIQRLVGVFWVLRPHLIRVYSKHIAQSDTVSDQPSVRLLRQALDDHTRFAAWGDTLICSLAQEVEQLRYAVDWSDHLTHLLAASGGLLGDLTPIRQTEAKHDHAPQRLTKPTPVRDARFTIAPYERKEGRAATDVWDRESFVKYMFMMVEGEVEATEACGQTLFDYPDAPWELRFLIARQLWDEARHAELSLQRFQELGGKLDMLPVRDTFPLYFGPIHNDDLAKRLAHLNQVVEGWVTDDFAMMVDICRQLDDERSARLFEQLIADEWLHIKIGGDWIPRLTANNPAYRAEVVKYRLQVEQNLYNDLDAAAKETAARFANSKGA
jgi:hypothetical protein